jgi:2-keto-4-pentenoate hydratase/2-oxohepta-3-ene-1,7-dioic acid hydratase in catechol pathway
MKLITFSADGHTRLGALVNNDVIDLAAAAALEYGDGASTNPTVLAALTNMQDCLTHWAQTHPLLQDLLGKVDASYRATVGSVRYPLDQVKLEAPVPNPGKIACIGLNYADHCREQDVPLPERPLLFAKFPSAVIAPGEDINWPAGASSQVDYEAELAVVIGRTASRVRRENALAHIAGYTIVNDVSARDVQFADGQWIRGKSFDTFCPMGPYMLTADEIEDPQNLTIKCEVNGKSLQDSNTFEMIFPVAEIIAFISRTSTLNPGDVICTGTPAGVGVFRDPKVFLNPGDVVSIEIEKLGQLKNQVA